MKYGDIKREVLSHINQYTMRGTPVASAYNCQEDYENRIPHLINEALVNIRTFAKRLVKIHTLDHGECVGNMMRYRLPDDFYTLKSGGVTATDGKRLWRSNAYRLQGRRYILIPAGAQGEYTVEYYAYPLQLPMDCKDDYEFDEDLEVIQTATYYAAAALVRMEDEHAYATLYNDYESRLERMSPGVAMEVSPVIDAYGFHFGGEW